MFQHKEHVDLWLWLAKRPQMEKEDWPGWVDHWNIAVSSQCFACVACEECENCPLVWPKNKLNEPCCHSGGLFSQWTFAESEERAKLALQIANLPVKGAKFQRGNPVTSKRTKEIYRVCHIEITEGSRLYRVTKEQFNYSKNQWDIEIPEDELEEA